MWLQSMLIKRWCSNKHLNDQQGTRIKKKKKKTIAEMSLDLVVDKCANSRVFAKIYNEQKAKHGSD